MSKPDAIVTDITTELIQSVEPGRKILRFQIGLHPLEEESRNILGVEFYLNRTQTAALYTELIGHLSDEDFRWS